MIERTKTLLPMQTVIGVINLPIKGQTRTFQILYGGALNPWFEGQMLIAPFNLYENQLRNFFENEGKEYIIPSRTEIAQVCADVKNNYLNGLYGGVGEEKQEDESDTSLKVETTVINNEVPSLKEEQNKEIISEIEEASHSPAKEEAGEFDQETIESQEKVSENIDVQEEVDTQEKEENLQEENQEIEDEPQEELTSNELSVQQEPQIFKKTNTEEPVSSEKDAFASEDKNVDLSEEQESSKQINKLSVEDFMVLSDVNENSKLAAENSLNSQNQIKELRLVVAKQIETINNLNGVIARQNDAIIAINENFEKFKKKNKGFSSSGQKKVYIAILVSMIITVGMIILSQLYLPKMESAIKLQNNTDAEVHIVVHNQDGTDSFERIGSIVVNNGKISIGK